jgi:dolichol-phosphate mannosyltransferase
MAMEQQFKTVVVLPTYNEKDNLPKIVERLLSLKIPSATILEILVVDDNSPDGTGAWALEREKNDPRVHLLSRTEKDGLGRAYLAGFKWAIENNYDHIVQMDADFSHSPEDVPNLIEGIIKNDADLALGSRYAGGIRVINWPLRRLMLSVGASYYVKWITGMPIWDPTGGFKCWKRETLKSIDLPSIKSNGYGFQIEMNHRTWIHGLKVTEVPIIFADRIDGVSKMSKTIVFEALFMVWKILFEHGGRRRPFKNTKDCKEHEVISTSESSKV